MDTPIDETSVMELEQLTSLAQALHSSPGLRDAMQMVANMASDLLKTPRASIRLFSFNQTDLIAVCRVGEALHFDAARTYKRGEGLIGWVAEQARPARSGHPEQDPRYVKRLDLKEPMGSFLGVPLMAGRGAMGVLSAVNSQHDYFTAHHEALMMLLAAICAPRIEVARLSHLSKLDPLTGALNRRGLDDLFPEEIQSTSGLAEPYSVAMVEVDRFPSINDNFGHAVGDGVLKHVVRVLTGMLHEGQSIVRYGGDDFLVLLPAIGLEAAERVARALCKAIDSSHLVMGGISVPIDINVGVAQREPDERREELIRRVEAALASAREEGRTRVAVSR